MAKKEYIERNALIAEYDRVHIGPPGGARKLMEDAPTADVAEVKHGEWKNVPPYRAWSGEYLKGQECSVCHSFFISEGNTPYSNHPYCCECGAKMDGGKI